MIRRVFAVMVLAGATSSLGSGQFAALRHWLETLQQQPQELDVRVAMRDGVHLSTNVFRPSSTGKIPVILVRTPYGKGTGVLAGYRLFMDHGYAVVVQDSRGRYGSEGVFGGLEQEGPDGYDTIEWIVRQPWSNGRVVMSGGSYLGMVQWLVALLNNPHLKAIAPVVAGSDEYRDRFYSPGGAFKLGHRLLWMSDVLRAPGTQRPPMASYTNHLPLRTADAAATGRRIETYQRVLDHPAYDAWWQRRSVLEHIGQVQIPVLAVGGWYDNYAAGDLDAFTARHHMGRMHRIIIGPWPHDMSQRFEGMDYGAGAAINIRRSQLEWFDRWAREVPAGTAPAQPPKSLAAPVRIFVMGINRWRDEDDWPLERQRPTRLYLAGKGRANTLSGDGVLAAKPARRSAADAFLYDPRHPVPTHGGAVCCNSKLFPWGPMDQRVVERRADVLVYSSPPLRQNLEVTGPVRAVLSVSTSAPDTDFTAKLVDVYPDGRAINLTDGILRLRYRESVEKPSPAPAYPRTIYTITIDVGVTANVFLAGHRIRVEISSSNFPRFDRNLNTGKPAADDTEMRTARQTVYHDARHPSYLLVPVIPADGREKGGRR